MSGRNYPRIGAVDFGRQLVLSGDLDPVYLLLNRSPWDEAQKLRWLVAYAAFYSVPVACWMSEFYGSDFWLEMRTAARNESRSPVLGRWPRGRERRHFRGAAATSAIEAWRGIYGDRPEDMFLYIAGPLRGVSEPFERVAERARRHRSVGNWMAFKMVDLVDACLGAEVGQSDVRPFLYDTPRESLLRMFREEPGLAADRRNLDRRAEIGEIAAGDVNDAAIATALAWLAHSLRDLTIPHKPGRRPLDLFCLETIACKHLSHVHGHYPLNNDLDEIEEALGPWARIAFCPAAETALGIVEEIRRGGARG